MNVADTIFAVSSAPGRSQRSLLRVCGPMACEIFGWEDAQRGCMIRDLLIGEHRVPAMVLVSRAPNSYSGDDMVELLLPGGQAFVNLVQNEITEYQGASVGVVRQAEPGEFSARAYLNGRIDLLQAEGIAESIRAQTDSQLRASSFLRGGQLSAFVGKVTDRITELAGLVEAGIDFTDEEDVVAISNTALLQGITEVLSSLEARLKNAVALERIDSVPMVVLAGPPNAGKSTLFNALIGKNRTVVTSEEGTTRDVIVEPLVLCDGDLEILLADLAGLESTLDGTDAIAGAMQQQAMSALGRSDLVIRCTPADAQLIEIATDAPILDVRTKADLGAMSKSDAACVVSAHTGEGLDALRTSIVHALGGMQNSLGAGVVALTQRHQVILERVEETLKQTEQLLDDPGAPAELLAATMRNALDALGELVGRVTPDDVLDHVFARFCVGK